MLRASIVVLVVLVACGPVRGTGGAPDCSSATSASVGGPQCLSYGDAGAGAPCLTDCDCCGHACTMEHVCAAPCPAP